MTEIIIAGIAFFSGLGIRHFWPAKTWRPLTCQNTGETPVTFVAKDGRSLRLLPGERGWL